MQANAGAIAKVVGCVLWMGEEDVAAKEDVARVAEARAEEAMMVAVVEVWPCSSSVRFE